MSSTKKLTIFKCRHRAKGRASFVKRVKKFSLIGFLFLSGFYKESGSKRKGKPGALPYTLPGFDAVRFLLFSFAWHEVPYSGDDH